eukprot:TRINITY_DN2238_c0_g1_i2.p1 TRINITY_DN2238_c0_g1~~TRINITY_DN2238_c0_g1_i2.p1  ORF type:complete len:281 (+),score=77.41 TRINITY_DN2238_c0_g1_i2:147-989(+)
MSTIPVAAEVPDPNELAEVPQRPIVEPVLEETKTADNIETQLKEYHEKNTQLENVIEVTQRSQEMLIQQTMQVVDHHNALKDIVLYQASQIQQLHQQLITLSQSLVGAKRYREEDSGESSGERPSKKIKQERKSLDAPPSIPEEMRKSLRAHFPTNLGTRYLLAALLCCAQNGLGAQLIVNEVDQTISGVEVQSYRVVKLCCLFINREILQKKVTPANEHSWDKTFKQRWFVNWNGEEQFTALLREDKKEQVKQRLQGHTPLTDEEKKYLQEHAIQSVTI